MKRKNTNKRIWNKIKNFILITLAIAMAIIFFGSICCIASDEYFSYIPVCTMFGSGLYLLIFLYANNFFDKE